MPKLTATRRLAPGLALAVLLLAAPAAAQQPAGGEAPRLELRPCRVPNIDEEARCGTYWAAENRDVRGGRRIPVDVVVLPARSGNPQPDPIFFLLGGPGQTATEYTGMWARSSLRENREVVLVDQRGTGKDHRLHCVLPGSDANLQGYLENVFKPEVMGACRRELEARADLSRYVTADFVDDLDEVRRALGYEKVNLMGGSYGTRVGLLYLRQYPEHARAAILTGLFPITLRNPLYHARDSQTALDSVFALCAVDAACNGAFPSVRREFDEVMERLRRQPARVTVPHPRTQQPVEITLDANGFGEAVRVMLYGWDRARRVPFLVHGAHGGDYAPFVMAALSSNRGLRDILRFGLLMSTICGEDVHRITEEDIVRETAGTFLGDQRVRTQKAACDAWPRRPLPASYYQPVRSDAPVLLLSGRYDPATAARWGHEAARTLPNGLHVVVPGSHTPFDPCIERLEKEFLDRGTARGLDTSCVSEMKLAPFVTSAEGS